MWRTEVTSGKFPIVTDHSSKIESARVTHAGLCRIRRARLRPMRKNFSRCFFKSASTERTFFWRRDENHADPHVERLKQFAGVNFAELGKVLEDCRHGPGSEVNFRFHATGQHAGQVSGDAAAGDVREGGNPAARDDVFQRGRVNTSEASAIPRQFYFRLPRHRYRASALPLQKQVCGQVNSR